jgi:hypothetical protein
VEVQTSPGGAKIISSSRSTILLQENDMSTNTQLHWLIGTAANVTSCLISKTMYLLHKHIGWNVYSSPLASTVNEVDDILCDLMITYDHRDYPIF